MSAAMYLGIDAAKSKFDAVLITAQGKPRHRIFANTDEGLAALSQWLEQHSAPQVHACLEATGTFAEGIARHLACQGHKVSLVNPSAIWAFRHLGLWPQSPVAYQDGPRDGAAIDKVDATLIAQYCQMHQPPAWTPPAAEISELQALIRRLESLVQMRTMETMGWPPGSRLTRFVPPWRRRLRSFPGRSKRRRRRFVT